MFMLFPIEFLFLSRQKKKKEKSFFLSKQQQQNWETISDGVSLGAQALCLQKLHIHARVNDLSLQLSLTEALEKRWTHFRFEIK